MKELAGYWELSYRTWRIDFIVTEEEFVSVIGIRSGYSDAELSDPNEPYSDKQIHNLYLNYLL